MNIKKTEPVPYTFENGAITERTFKKVCDEVEDWFESHFGLWPDDAMKRKIAAARNDLLQRLRLHL